MRRRLDRYAPDDPHAARAIAHLATGFPLFAEERYDGGPGSVWLIAESFTYGDEATDGGPPDPASRTSERAPAAGSDASHWPVELRYVRHGDTRYLLRFRGTSWEDWSVEVREPDGSWRLVDRELPGEVFETEGGAFLDEGATADRDGFARAPGPELIAGWRETTGLGKRVVVGLAEIPGATISSHASGWPPTRSRRM